MKNASVSGVWSIFSAESESLIRAELGDCCLPGFSSRQHIRHGHQRSAKFSLATSGAELRRVKKKRPRSRINGQRNSSAGSALFSRTHARQIPRAENVKRIGQTAELREIPKRGQLRILLITLHAVAVSQGKCEKFNRTLPVHGILAGS
jgi:hypothetical protein